MLQCRYDIASLYARRALAAGVFGGLFTDVRVSLSQIRDALVFSLSLSLSSLHRSSSLPTVEGVTDRFYGRKDPTLLFFSLTAMAEVARPRMLFAGAGTAIQFPLNHTPLHAGGSAAAAAAAAAAETHDAASPPQLQNAYLVTPDVHIGRVVTGVVFMADQTRLLSREFAQHVVPQTGSVLDQFGLASISFADKLAEQGYKVLVLNVVNDKSSDSEPALQMEVVEQAVLYLKQKQDIQRVALCGVGAGADLATKMSIEKPAFLDCSILMCPNGNLAWSKPEDAPAPPPMLLLVGDKNPYATSDAVR